MTTQGTVGWGLIGASTIAAEFLVPALQAHRESEIVAVLSASADRGGAFADRHGIPRAYSDLNEFLQDDEVDAVYISTTNEKHEEQTVAAASAGKHVLCEKPLALTLDAARTMIVTCQDAGVVMATNHHLRNAATHRAIRRLIREGAIGEPVAARVFHAVALPKKLHGWRIQTPEAGGGVILDITVHDADTLRFVLGDEIEEVAAMTATQGLAQHGLEDAVMGTMRTSRGVLVSFHDAFTVPEAGTGFEVHGTDGSLVGRHVMTQRPVGDVLLRRDGGEELVDVGPREDLYEVGVRAFVDAMRGVGPPSASGEDGVRSLAVALAAAEAARSGHVCKVVGT